MFSKIGHQIQKMIAPMALATLVLFVLGLIMIVVPQGYADDGTFQAVLNRSGLYSLPHAATMTNMNVHYGIRQYFFEGGGGLTSQVPFIRLAILLNQIFVSRTVFDIRSLGLVYFAIYLGLFYLLGNAMVGHGRQLRHYVQATVMTVVFGDSAFLLYFNSFYGEPVILLSLMAIVASVLLLVRRQVKHAWLLVLLYIIGTATLILLRQQNAVMAIPMILVTLGLIGREKTRQLRFGWFALAVVVGLFGIVSQSQSNPAQDDLDAYQSMTRGTLLFDTKPEQSLKDGNINPQFAILKGTTYYQPGLPLNAHSQTMQRQFLDRFNTMWLFQYYWLHPAQTNQLLNLAATNAQILQIKSVGDRPATMGKTQHVTQWMTLYSSLISSFFPTRFAFYILLAIALGLVYGFGAFYGYSREQPELVVKFYLVLGLMVISLITLIGAILLEGDPNLARRLFPVGTTTVLLGLMLFTDSANRKLFLPEDPKR